MKDNLIDICQWCGTKAEHGEVIEHKEGCKKMPEQYPQFQYDCQNCKFNWCCGYCCFCNFKELPEPPVRIKFEINKARVENDLSLEHYI